MAVETPGLLVAAADIPAVDHEEFGDRRDVFQIICQRLALPGLDDVLPFQADRRFSARVAAAWSLPASE